MSGVRLMLGDCLERMKEIESGTVDLILADLPYGTTQNKWDSVVPLDTLWAEYLRVAKPTAAFVFTASQPFTAALVMSNPKLFKHEWVWIKNRGSNFANTVREPMKEHESVLVFSRGKWTYNKQMQERTGGGASRAQYGFEHATKTSNYGAFSGRSSGAIQELRVPSSWQKFNCEVGLHPTQKPVALMEYLIRTYAVPGMTVLDNTMGSGTTGVAALRCGCDFIGIELDPTHFETASARIDDEAVRLATPVPQFDLFAEVANV
ncbi:DNA-methyltransferase [Stutzerimonas kunmingensis]|uniref:DNA-methyltransferase n=1 Tax=Stutzerimonas kunmingensis TaxID=1211807 RepID=UPI0028A58EF3|nr:site-specific DNA-methyltransferase [Stutzerimonas kunmingensis]